MFIKFILVICISLSSVTDLSLAAHPYYVSIYELLYNDEKNRIELNCKIFRDDLLKALREQEGGKSIEETDEKYEQAIKEYLNSKMHMQLNSQMVNLKFVGYEFDENVCWIYFSHELKNSGIKNLEFKCTALFEVYSSQANMVHITISDRTKSFLLRQGKSKLNFRP